MAIVLSILATTLLILLVAGYIYVKRTFNYWKNKNVHQLTPTFPFGNFSSALRQQQSLGSATAQLYAEHKDHPFVGVYVSLRPALLVNDPELVKNILIRDFQHFHDRGFYVNEKTDPLSGHLFALSGDKWKSLRAKLMPTFTTSKLKGMFGTMLDTGKKLQDHFENIADVGQTVEIRDILARYSTDIIASVAFGLECDSLKNPNAKFREVGKKFFEVSFRNNIQMAMNLLVPKLSVFLNLKSTDNDVENFMMSMVQETMDYREKNNVSRRDFMQLMLQLRNVGKVSLDDDWDLAKTNEADNKQVKSLTLQEVTAQAFVFFLAGFETSSTTMSFCVFELAKNKEIQKKLQQEIDTTLEKYSNQLTYDGIMEMQFLEQCMDETLRKYPPLPLLNRECTIPYRIPGTDIELEKGTSIIIPLKGLQHDPKYYPEPEKFKPERFSVQGKQTRKDLLTYAPFGDGPRICIGSRMGKMMTKVGLVLMLTKFNFELGDDMEQDLKLSCGLILSPEKGINVKVIRR